MDSKLIFLLLSATVLVQGRQILKSESLDESKPWFCHDLDCPEYKVVKTAGSYEIREYKGGNFATTHVESLLYSIGVTEGFKRLFDYISGKNDGNKKIAMTAPVVVRIVPGDGPFCKSLYETSFWIPSEYQKDPPEPSNAEVYVYKTPHFKVAVLQFGGFVADDWTVSHKANVLKEALDADKVSYNKTAFFSVGYDPPTRLQHRHNEVWLLLDTEDTTNSIVAQ